MKHISKSSSPKLEKLSIAKITTDAGTQCRAGLNDDTVSDYADLMEAGKKFPPLVVFADGKDYWLADGFHRLAAAGNLGKKQIDCDLHNGTRLDAIKFSLGANADHGLRRTNADKRRAVEVALVEWPNVADAELARWCAVSHPFVANVRKEVQPVTVTGSRRLGHDGKLRHVLPPKAENLDALVPQDRFGEFIQSQNITIDLPEDSDGGGDFITLMVIDLGYKRGAVPTGQEILDLLAAVNPARQQAQAA